VNADHPGRTTVLIGQRRAERRDPPDGAIGSNDAKLFQKPTRTLGIGSCAFNSSDIIGIHERIEFFDGGRLPVEGSAKNLMLFRVPYHGSILYVDLPRSHVAGAHCKS